jgi:serine/threonine protein kinase
MPARNSSHPHPLPWLFSSPVIPICQLKSPMTYQWTLCGRRRALGFLCACLLKIQMEITYLKKRGGARFYNVSTYRVVCNDPAANIILTTSLKFAHEVGSHDDDFVHVAKGRLQKYGKDCIVKVHHAVNPLYDRELRILQHLCHYQKIVQYVCHFSCMDKKERWIHDILAHKPILPCSITGTDNLAFIVMEYISNGSITDFFNVTPSFNQLKSLFLQTALLIIELGMKHKVYHGDLNSGNILLKRTHANAMITFDMEGGMIKINTHGIRPVLIDFGRGGFYDKKAKNRSLIMDDIMIAFSMYSNWVKHNEPFVKSVRAIIAKHSHSKKKASFHELMDDIKSLQ